MSPRMKAALFALGCMALLGRGAAGSNSRLDASDCVAAVQLPGVFR